jgi:hypothetical protein
MLMYCEITFIREVPIFVVFVDRLIHEIKNPTNNEIREAVWHRYIAMLVLEWPQLSGQDQLHRGQLTILMTKYLNMCKNDRNVYLWKDFNNFL